MKILMVCMGNICRSPLAEGIMQDKVRQQRLDWQVDSAGTISYHAGESPDPRSQAVAQTHGIDISKQVARHFSSYDFEVYDLIYVMDKANYRDVLKHAQTEDEKGKVKMILNELRPGEDLEVPDPYWDDDGFEQVFEMLDEACEMIISRQLQEK